MQGAGGLLVGHDSEEETELMFLCTGVESKARYCPVLYLLLHYVSSSSRL